MAGKTGEDGSEQSGQPADFALDSPLFDFFESALLSDAAASKPVLDAKYAFIRASMAQDKAQMKSLTELLFDVNVFNMVKAELGDNFSFDLKQEIKLFEIVAALKESGLIDKLFDEMQSSVERKLSNYICKAMRFFVWTAKRHSLLPSRPEQIDENHALLGRPDLLGMCLVFASHAFRVNVVVVHRLCLILKLGDQKSPKFVDFIFDRLTDNFKFCLEKLLPTEGRISTDELSVAARDVRDFLQLSLIEVFLIISKFNLLLEDFLDQITAFLENPQMVPAIRNQAMKFTQYLTSITLTRAEKHFDMNVGQNKRLEDLTRVELDPLDVDDKNKPTDLKTKSAYSTFILNKKQSLEVYVAYEKYLNDVNMITCVNTASSPQVLARVLILRNHVTLRLLELVEKRLINHPSMTQSASRKDPYWVQINQIVSNNLGFEVTEEQQISSAQLPNFKTYTGEKFWNSNDSFDFFEKCFISLENLSRVYFNSKDAILIFWRSLNTDILKSLNKYLDIKLDEVDHAGDLHLIYRTALSKDLESKLRSKELSARDSMTFEDTFVLCLLSLFKMRDYISSFFVYVKYNFDLMLDSFFEEAKKQSAILPAQARVQYKTLQLREFQNSLLSFDRIYIKYVNDQTIAKLFILNSLQILFRGLNEFVAQNKTLFSLDKKSLKNYYLSFQTILTSTQVFKNNADEIEDLCKNYKALGKMMFATDLDAQGLPGDSMVGQSEIISAIQRSQTDISTSNKQIQN